MKSKDLPMIILIAGVSALIALFASRLIFAPGKLSTRVEVVDPISSTFNYEDKPYFGPNALNPTKDITVDENNNQQPLE